MLSRSSFNSFNCLRNTHAVNKMLPLQLGDPPNAGPQHKTKKLHLIDSLGQSALRRMDRNPRERFVGEFCADLVSSSQISTMTVLNKVA